MLIKFDPPNAKHNVVLVSSKEMFFVKMFLWLIYLQLWALHGGHKDHLLKAQKNPQEETPEGQKDSLIENSEGQKDPLVESPEGQKDPLVEGQNEDGRFYETMV